MITMISAGGPTSPENAAIAPGMPRRREPNTKVRLTMLGPGRKWQSAKVSLNSSAVIHLCWSTMSRRAHTSTPPKPASDILAKATKSVMRLGGDLEISGAVTAADDESGGMTSFKGRPVMGQPLIRHIHPSHPSGHLDHRVSPKLSVSSTFPALSFSTFAPYIEGAGSLAMEINDRRNKPFGPGGSTRRLHQNPLKRPLKEWVSAGAKQDRRGRKGRVFSRYGSADIGPCNSCKRQLCSGCSGCVTQFERPS